MSTSTNSSSHFYVALPADSTTSTASASTTAAAAGAGFPSSSSPSSRVVRTKRRCLGLSSGCLLILLLGLLLFFLVPRRPIVRYQSSTLSLDEGTSSATLTQLFSYYNPNYYTVYVDGVSVPFARAALYVSPFCLEVGTLWELWEGCDPGRLNVSYHIHPSFPLFFSGNGITFTSKSKTKTPIPLSATAGTIRVFPFEPFLPVPRV